ncbi:bifunctional 2-C-methyl-D-erythritol 4-phosphate cytidylyltransferase/2-C-methyl-D-erythritol 2,4-cyclodiphosphate synthase [Helicobacter sp. MIT 14-3879]|nr:bifunctional 2-C-methyl-D-erythritol 4-phosphate cytidylyltransferase/2-C-methyl-D-erythritol 2,4-cyclodiphosphate synthase [Helicobacter sp. MIT 14-3879]
MSAGESTRFRKNLGIKKHWIRIDSKPIWLYVADKLQFRYNFNRVLITAHKSEVKYMKKFCDYEIIEGGDSRKKSLQNALNFVTSDFVIVSDAARFNLDFDVLDMLISQKLDEFDCIIPTLNIVDTIFIEESGVKNYIDRDNVRLVQTPQISKVNILKQALSLGDFSDESSAINKIGGKILAIDGSNKLNKLTYFDDIKNCNIDSNGEILIGYGFDVHKFCTNKKLILGGVEIDCEFGLEAHSDGDVILHSLCDAILGAIGAGDIGEWFPVDDDRFNNIDSKVLLKEVIDFSRSVGFSVVNVDIMILAQIPKITPHKDKMISVMSAILGISRNYINIKATTMEKMGFIGREEGICVSSNVSLKYTL